MNNLQFVMDLSFPIKRTLYPPPDDFRWMINPVREKIDYKSIARKLVIF